MSDRTEKTSGKQYMEGEPGDKVRAVQEPSDPQEGAHFSSTQLALVLGITSKGVRKRLRNDNKSHETTLGSMGQETKSWKLADLPAKWVETISMIAKRKGFRNAEEFLSDKSQSPWLPEIPIEKVTERFRQEAERWCKALLPVLMQQHQLRPGDLITMGLEHARAVFGREISESTWRRHFDLAVKRDRGYEQWARVDIHLPEEAFSRPPEPIAKNQIQAQEMEKLTAAFAEVGNLSNPSIADKDAVWDVILTIRASAKVVLDYVFNAIPGLARTRNALKKAFRRRLLKPKDGRSQNKGRPKKSLCPDCEAKVAGAALDSEGELAPAWREAQKKPLLCSKCIALWHFDPRSNKTYVPRAVVNQVKPKVCAAAPWAHSARFARANGPYLLRRRDIGPGDVFEGDDVTWNHIFYVWHTDGDGRPYVGRGECLLFLDRGSWLPVGYRLIAGNIGPDGRQIKAHYTGIDIRLGVLHVHDRVGLPRKGFLFENGIWASRIVVGRRVRGWNFNKWREFERGLNENGIILGANGDPVRHSLPGNPRSKIAEALLLALQKRMRHLPGFVGFNHREYNPKLLNEFLRRVNQGDEHPGSMFLSLVQMRDALDEVIVAYADTPQNGRWLPGVSPMEVWQNGIGQFSGVSTKPLEQLHPSSRHLLSTHWRLLDVTEKGIRFQVGKHAYVFWGDELMPWRHKQLPGRWNLEQPELLHCLPPAAEPFTLKLREIDSWTATPADLAEAESARRRWLNYGKALYDNLPRPLSPVVRCNALDANLNATGAAISKAVAEHREQGETEARNSKRLAALAGALGMPKGKDENPSPRAIEARKRRLARAEESDGGMDLEAGNAT